MGDLKMKTVLGLNVFSSTECCINVVWDSYHVSSFTQPVYWSGNRFHMNDVYWSPTKKVLFDGGNIDNNDELFSHYMRC